jgi:hypothetical protein
MAAKKKQKTGWAEACSCLLVHSFSQTVTVWLMFRQYTNKTVDLWRHYKMTSPRSGIEVSQ